MSALLISNIVLWVIVLALVAVVVALTRQIGVLYERVAPAGALMLNNRVETGMQGPRFTLESLTGDTVEIGAPLEAGRGQLLFFLSPDCPVCDSLLPVIRSGAKSERDWLSVVLASDGSEADHTGFITDKGLWEFPYVVSRELGMSYGVGKLPYAVLLDEEGKVASLGIVNSREHLESLFEAKERKVASIQEYLRQSREKLNDSMKTGEQA